MSHSSPTETPTELRIGQRINLDGHYLIVKQLYRVDRQILVERKGELSMVDWPTSTAAPAAIASSGPAERCAKCDRPTMRGKRTKHIPESHVWHGAHGVCVRCYRPQTGVALEGLVACMICGWKRHNLGRHLSNRHGIDSHEYRRRFPGAECQSRHKLPPDFAQDVLGGAKATLPPSSLRPG
jgi:hypothetical protein